MIVEAVHREDWAGASLAALRQAKRLSSCKPEVNNEYVTLHHLKDVAHAYAIAGDYSLKAALSHQRLPGMIGYRDAWRQSIALYSKSRVYM